MNVSLRVFGRRMVSLALMALLLTGCKQSVNLDAVRAMSKSAADAQQSFDAVAEDFRQSCVRKLRWQYMKATSISPTGDLRGIRESDYSPQRCDDPLTLAAVQRWKTINRLYLGYFIALGNIAGAKSDASAYGVQAFAKSVTANQTDGATTKAANLLTPAIDEFFNVRKRNAISQFAGNDGMKFIVPTANDLVTVSKILDDSLGMEHDAVDDFYRENFKHAKGGTDMLSALRYRQDWSADLKGVEDRRAAIVAYQHVINDLQQSHAALVESIKDDRPEALSSVIQLYVTEFQPLVEQLNKAFK